MPVTSFPANGRVLGTWVEVGKEQVVLTWKEGTRLVQQECKVDGRTCGCEIM